MPRPRQSDAYRRRVVRLRDLNAVIASWYHEDNAPLPLVAAHAALLAAMQAYAQALLARARQLEGEGL